MNSKPPKFFLVFLAALIAIGPFAMDAYLPAMPAMALDLGVDVVVLNYTISWFLLGNAIGQLVGGPASDQLGRKPLALAGLICFLLTTIGILLSGSIQQIQGLRFLQAVGAGLGSVVALAALRDVYEPRVAARKLPIVISVMMLAPLVAPTIGSLLLMFHWRLIFVVLCAYAALVLLWYLLWVPESRSGPRERLSPSDWFAKYLRVLRHRHKGRLTAVRYVLATAFSAGVMMVFITHSAFTYIEYLQISPAMFPAYFGANVVALMLANLSSTRLMQYHDPQFLFRLGTRLQVVLTFCLLVIVLLGRASIVTVVPLVVLSIGIGGLINPCGSAMLFAHFQRLTGSVSAVSASMMFIAGGFLGGVAGWFWDTTLFPVALMMFISAGLGSLLAHTIPPATLEELAQSPVENGL